MSVPAQQLQQYQPQRSMSALDVRSHVNLVQDVMKAVMKEGTHFGTIPGTPKPTLYKPGAEVLAATFRIAVSYRTEDLSTEDCIRYRVTAIGTHQVSGQILGEGLGECSSNEEKYKWRKAYDPEWNASPENKRRIKYGKYTVKQVRTEIADVANTVLKMAAKRAQVAMTLNVVAASDCFTQDIEDLPEGMHEADDEPQSKSAAKPAYPQADFDKNKPAWAALVAGGTATAADILAKLESRATLTDEQKKQINGLKPAAQPAAQGAAP